MEFLMPVFEQKAYKGILLQQNGATQLFHITIRAGVLGLNFPQK
jgi:hypothetical protein